MLVRVHVCQWPSCTALDGNDAARYFGSALGDVCAALVRKHKLGRDPTLGALHSGDRRLRWIGRGSMNIGDDDDHTGGGGGSGGGGRGGGYDGGGFMPSAPSSAYSAAPSWGPANGVSIRAIEDARYQIVDEASGVVIEEVEASKAFWEVYEGAIYLNQAGGVSRISTRPTWIILFLLRASV